MQKLAAGFWGRDSKERERETVRRFERAFQKDLFRFTNLICSVLFEKRLTSLRMLVSSHGASRESVMQRNKRTKLRISSLKIIFLPSALKYQSSGEAAYFAMECKT